MAYSHFDRLSAQGAAFLEVEDENAHMHVGAVAVFEGGPLVGPEGGVDFDRVRRIVAAGLPQNPRYRQRLAWIPVLNHPVWVDDPRFRLHYHLRHTSLPHPGDERQLKRFAGHLLARPLDRSKPLWEMWVVEGLPEGRFAIVQKTHHCMTDGVEMLASLLGPEAPAPGPGDEPPRWVPRPAPGPAELLAAEMRRRAGGGLRAARALLGAAADPAGAASAARDAVLSVGETLGAALRPASDTPLNVAIGPHRRFDWTRFEMADVKEVKERLGGTVNDVVLANVAGALRRFLQRRGEDVDRLDFRAMVPVSVRSPRESGAGGNRVTTRVAPLPLSEPSARGRLARVVETTRRLEASGQAKGLEVIEELADWTLTPLFSELARLAARSRPYNVVVTHVPGPPFEVSLAGSPLREAYPLVPLYRNQAVGIALVSYAGQLFWGFHADWDAVPDLHDLVEATAADFESLRKAAAGA